MSDSATHKVTIMAAFYDRGSDYPDTLADPVRLAPPGTRVIITEHVWSSDWCLLKLPGEEAYCWLSNEFLLELSALEQLAEVADE